MTYREQFESALRCRTKEEAAKWLQDEIKRYEADFGKSPKDAEKIILSTLGYMAGYYDQPTSQKVYDLFGAEHPVFGKPDYWTRITSKNAFVAGAELAKKFSVGFRP